jgi:hypothetical protein
MTKITVLRVSEKGKQAAKTICLDESGNIPKPKFNAGTWFHYSQKEVKGIKELSTFLLTLAHDNQALLIRGELAPCQDPKKLVRRIGVKGHGKDGFFQSSPAGQPWILLDFDGITTPSAISFITNPNQAIEYLISLLPPYFQGVSYHYHLSSQAGLDDGKTIRAHLWYWLDQPVTENKLRIWAKNIDPTEKLIDHNLFQEVQAHYTADPVFKGVTDPFPKNRSGFVKGKTDAVAFPAISVPTFAYSSEVTGLTPTEAFIHYISAVGDHEGGMGFRIPLRQASWYYVLENGVEGTDKAALKQKLREVIAKADQSKHTPNEIHFKASDAFLNGLIDGAIAKFGAKGKTGKIEGLEPHYQHKKMLSAKEAGAELETLVRSYFDSPRHMAIRAGAGLGKTTQVIAGLANLWMHGKKIELYVPSHKLAEEVAGKLSYHPFKKAYFSWQSSPKSKGKGMAPTGIQWQVIRGRNYLTKGGDPHCLKSDIASALSERGLPVFPNLCRSGTQSCEYYGECDYIKQFNSEYDVRVYPHSYLGLDRGFLDKEMPDLAAIDESFYQTLLVGLDPKLKPISLSEIKAAEWPEELRKTLLLYPPDEPLLSYLRSQLGEDGAIDCIDWATAEYTAPANTGIIALPQSEQLEIAKKLKGKSRLDSFLWVLKTELLAGRDECHGIVFQEHDKEKNKVEGFLLNYRRPITRFVGANQGEAVEVPVLAIDADLTPLVHREFFPNTEFHEISTERKCHVVQCYSTKNSKASFTFDKDGEKRIAGVQSIIDRVSSDHTTLVFGPQVITGNPDIEPVIKPRVTVPIDSALAHFNAIRGIDVHKEKDAIIVISRNQPSVAGVERVARALWFDAEEPLKLGVATFCEEARGYRTRAGYMVGVNVEVHPDPRVQILLELIREAETLQGIDRLRLVHIKKPKRVFLLSNLVLDLTVDNLFSWDEMIEGTTKLNDAWNELDGVLPLSVKWLSDKFPSLFSTEDIAKSYLKPLCQLGQLSNKLFIWDSTLLHLYAYTGKTGPPARCLSTYGLSKTKTHLETLLCKAITSIEQVE